MRKNGFLLFDVIISLALSVMILLVFVFVLARVWSTITDAYDYACASMYTRVALERALMHTQKKFLIRDERFKIHIFKEVVFNELEEHKRIILFRARADWVSCFGKERFYELVGTVLVTHSKLD